MKQEKKDEVIELYRHISNTTRPVDALALNAGIGAGGAFATETSLEDELRLIDLNVRSTVHLRKLVLADMEDTKVGSEEKDDPAEVARQGYEALIAGEEKVVGGSFKNKVQTVAGKVIPDSKKAEMHRQMAEPGSAEKD